MQNSVIIESLVAGVEAAVAVQSVPCRCSLRGAGRCFGQRGRQGQGRLLILPAPEPLRAVPRG